MDVGEEARQFCRGHRREAEADQARQDDRARRIRLDQPPADRLGVDAARPDAHEVARVERHRLEGVGVFGMRREDAADFAVARVEDLVLLLLLPRVGGIGERRDREVLADGRDVRHAAADVAGGLRLQRLELLRRRALERERDEPDAQAPDVILLRRAVELHGEHVFGERRERGEERLAVDARLVDEAEVGVVEDDDDPLARVRRRLDRRDDARHVLVRRRVARRVVRKVEDEELPVARGLQRRLHRRRVEAAVDEGVEVRDPAADRLAEDELVVVPEEVRRHERVVRIGEELRRDPQAVRQRVGDDGVGERDALQRRVLLELHLLPRLAQGREPERRRIEERAPVERDAFGEARHHHRRIVFLERHADRRVDVAAARLRALAQDAAVGKIHVPAGGRKELRRRAERLVELARQFIHDE